MRGHPHDDFGDEYFARTFDWMADRYLDQTRWLSRGGYDQWMAHAAEVVAADRPAAVVDLGAGPGYLLRHLKARLGDVRLVAVDVSANALAAIGDDRVETHCMPAETFAARYPDRFDAVTATFVIRDVAEPAAFLSAAARVLRRGGRVVVLETHRPRGPSQVGFHLYFHHWMPWWGRVRLAPDWPASYGMAPYSWLSASQRRWRRGQDLPRWLDAAGFRDVRQHRRPDDVVMLVTAIKA